MQFYFVWFSERGITNPNSEPIPQTGRKLKKKNHTKNNGECVRRRNIFLFRSFKKIGRKNKNHPGKINRLKKTTKIWNRDPKSPRFENSPASNTTSSTKKIIIYEIKEIEFSSSFKRANGKIGGNRLEFDGAFRIKREQGREEAWIRRKIRNANKTRQTDLFKRGLAKPNNNNKSTNHDKPHQRGGLPPPQFFLTQASFY